MRVTLAVLLGAAVATCRDAPMGPGRGGRASLALAPEWPALASNLAAFGLAIDSLRVVVVRPATDTVVDTTVFFAADQDSLALAISIPLEESPESLDVAMELRGGGFVLFTGSTSAEISAGSNPPIAITNFAYTGPGAGITSLQVTPSDSVIRFGDSLRYQVDAFAGATPVTQFYVSWSSSNATLAPINAHGVLLAPAQRAVVQVVATTPNGIADTVPVTFIPVPTSLVVVPPVPINVPPVSIFGPLRVRVLAADAQGVKGIPVTFAAVSGGGLVANATVITDSAGYAETGATSGTGGTSVYTATVAGLPPATFNVTVVGQAATQLAFAFPPTGAIVGQPFGVIVELRDATGAVVATATDPVTIALGANPGGATLGGTLTVNAVQGLAVFSDLTISQPDSGYTLVATAPGLTQATSPLFSVVPGFTGRMWTNAAGGNWSDPGNWSDSIVPAPGDTVYVALDGDYTVTLDVNVSVSMLFFGGGSGTQTMTGVSRTLTADSTLVLTPTAVLDLVGGLLGGPNSIVLNQGTIRLQNTPVSAATMLNYSNATLVGRGVTGVSGTLSNSFEGTVRIEGDPTCCNTAFSAGEFYNGGLVELTSINSSSTNVSLTVLGQFVNAAGATLAVLPGTGGSRAITAPLSNLGLVQIDYDVVLASTGATHSNSGTVQLAGGNLTVNQAGVGSFFNDGFLLIGAGRTLAISGGTFDYDSPAPGGIGGLGTLSLNNVTFGLDTDLGNDTLNINLINTQVLGSATLTSAAARTLTIQSTGIAVPFVNSGTFVVYGNSSLSNTVTTVGGSTMRLLGDPGCCNTTLTVASSFSNDGLIELTTTGGSTTNVALVVSTGTFFNSGTLAVLPGTGGGRTVQAQMANSGTVLVAHDVTFDASNVDYLNTGLIHLTTGNLTLNQSGSTPTFAANGPITVDAGRTFTVNGGTYQYSNFGELGGLGTVAFNGASVSVVATNVTHDTLSLSFVNSTVIGPGTLQNAAGRTLTILGTTVNAPFVNFGRLVTQATSSLGGAVTTNTGSAIEVRGDPGVGNAVLTVANGFTNQGLIELTQTGGPTASAQLNVSSGFLVNASAATVAIRAGTGGARNLDLALNNQGTVLVETSASLGGASADHVNSGTVRVSGAGTVLLIPQSGTTPTFSSTGTFVVDGGAQVNVSGGAFNYQNAAPGGLAGTGSLAFLNTVLNVTPNLSNDTLALSFTNSTVNGPGTLTNTVGRTLTIQQTALNAPFVNQGLLIVRATSSLGSSVNAAAGGTIRVEGDPGCCNTALSVANPLTNHGLIELTSVNGSATNVSLDVAGGLTNGPDGTLAIRAGTGGGRALPTAFTNNGQMLVETTASIGTANASYLNSGTITVSGGTVTLPLTGTTPVFTNQGVFTVAAGATVAVTGGPGGSFVNATSGTLAGVGAFDVSATTFTNSGTVAPGGSPGQLTFVGPLPFGAGAVVSAEIGGLTPGTQHDQIIVTSGTTLGGTLNVSLISGFTPAINDVFTIVSGAGVAGSFASLNLPSVAGAIWLPSVNAAGFQLTLVSASALFPVSWTGGGGDGLWGTPANWSTGVVPGVGDSAIINPVGPVTVVVNTNAAASFLDLGTAVGSGTKTLALGTNTLNLVAGGIVGGDGVVNFSGGTFTGGGTLQVNGAFNWSGGTMSGAGVVQVNPAGAMTLFGTASKFLNSRRIQTAGIVAWGDAGSVGTGGGAELVVQSGGTFAVNGNASWQYSLGGSQPRVLVELGGTLLRQVGTGVAAFSVPLDNNGVTQVTTGTLELRGGSSRGTFDVAAGAQIDLAGGVFSLLNGTQNTGPGLVRVVGATLDAVATTVFNRIHLVSGTIQGADALVVQDSLVWTGGTLGGTGNTQIATGADLVVNGNVTLNGRTITNGGTLTWLSGQISSGNGALIQNQSTGLVDLRHDGTWLYNLGGTLPRLSNQNGVVQRGTGTGVADIRAAVDNGGSVVMVSGTLALNGGGNSTGAFNVIPGTEMVFGGAHVLSGIVTAGGIVSFPSGTTNVNGSFDVTGQTVVNGGTVQFNGPDTARINQLAVQSGTLGGTGVVLVRVAGAVSGGTLGGTGELRIPSGATLDLTANLSINGRTLTNAGQVTWSAGQISSGNGAAFINQSGGVFDAPAPSNTWIYNLGGAQPVVNNQVGGLIRRAGISGTTTFGVPVNNAGAVDVQLGTLVFSVGGVATGAHTVAAGATLQYGSIANSWASGAGFGGPGRVLIPSGATVNIDAAAPDTVDARWIELAGGTIAGLGVLRTVDSLVWTGGSLTQAGVLRVPAGGLLAIRGANKNFVARTIANAGVVSWTGTGTISSGNGASLVNENGATFQLESDADWFYNQGGAVPHIDNLPGGLIKRAQAISAITVGAALNNDGILDLQTGGVTFSNGGASKGTLTVTSPATLGFGGGTHALDVTAVVNGTGAVQVSAGSVTTIGDYLVTGTTRITGGTIAFNGSKPAEITTLDLNGGTLSGVGQVFLHGAGSWLSGAMDSTGQFRVMPGATLTIDGSTSKTLRQRAILNGGTIVWKGTGPINSGLGAVLTNQTGATFDANADGSWLYNQGGTLPAFNNAGVVKRNAAFGTSVIQATVNNSGSFDISTGLLSLANGGTSTGLFSVAAGSDLDFGGGTHTISGTAARINGAGVVHFTAGLVTMSGSAPSAYDVTGTTFVDGGTATFNTADTARFTTLQLRGGTLGGSAHMVVRGPGSALWTGGALTAPAAGPVLRIPVGVTLTIGGTASRQFTARTIWNEGTVSWAGGSITATGTSPTLDVRANSTFDVSSPGQWSGASTIAVRDLANMKITVAGSVTIGPTTVINNDGLFDIQAGATLKLSGAFNQTGRGILMGSGVLDANGATTVTNAGTVRPGGTSSPGILTIIAPTSGATGWPQASGTILDIDVFGPEQGTGHDKLIITGRITTGGSLRMIGNGVYRPSGISLQIMTYGQQLGQTFGVSLLGGLTGLLGINYSLTDLRMQF